MGLGMTRIEAKEAIDAIEFDYSSLEYAIETLTGNMNSNSYLYVMESGSFVQNAKAILKKIYDTFHKALVTFRNFVKRVWRKFYSSLIKKIASHDSWMDKETGMKNYNIPLTPAEMQLINAVSEKDWDNLPNIDLLMKEPKIDSKKERQDDKKNKTVTTRYRYTITVEDFNKFIDTMVIEANRVDASIASEIGSDVTKEEINVLKNQAQYWSKCISLSMRIALDYSKGIRRADMYADTDFLNSRGKGDFYWDLQKDCPKAIQNAIQTKDPDKVRKEIMSYVDDNFHKNVKIEQDYLSVHNPAVLLTNLSRYAEKKGIDIFQDHKDIGYRIANIVNIDPKDWKYDDFVMLYEEMHENFSRLRLDYLNKMSVYFTYNWRDK